MTNELLKRLRAEFIELNEAVHSMRGDPRVTWQQEAPEYAATLELIEAEIRRADVEPKERKVGCNNFQIRGGEYCGNCGYHLTEHHR